jgi:hypothetical protein
LVIAIAEAAAIGPQRATRSHRSGQDIAGRKTHRGQRRSHARSAPARQRDAKVSRCSTGDARSASPRRRIVAIRSPHRGRPTCASTIGRSTAACSRTRSAAASSKMHAAKSCRRPQHDLAELSNRRGQTLAGGVVHQARNTTYSQTIRDICRVEGKFHSSSICDRNQNNQIFDV